MSAELPKMTPCGACGMPCDPAEYHPFAACLMYQACHNGDTVRANLEAIRQEAARQAMEKKERAERNRDMWKAQCEEQARRLEALHIGIAEHNADCIGQCEARKKIGKTSCYMLGYDRECGDCPRDGMVNLPEPPPTSGKGKQ